MKNIERICTNKGIVFGAGLDYITNKSKHYLTDRKHRLLIESDVYCVFEIDKGHRNGTEYHFLLENSKILIVNKDTHTLITILNARPQQLKRYFSELGCPNTKTFKKMLRSASNNVKYKKNI